MIPDAEKLALMIVGAEAFTVSLFQNAAEDSECYAAPVMAADGFEAMALLWDALETGRLPDVIVADFDLPEFNAIQLTRELRLHPETRHVFVAILSTTPAGLDRVAAETAGADYFAGYSIAPAELVARFQSIGRMCCGATELSQR